jgi:Fe-S-cluster containining protein
VNDALRKRDNELLHSIAASMEEAERRSGEWVACRAGCTPCCLGPFAITALDSWRLREGLAVLDPLRAHAVRQRARAYVNAIAAVYPGDAATGSLRDGAALPEEFDDVPCPALDPASGLCELYEWRPVTCRTFGPATWVGEESIGACELCYVGASEEQVAACAVDGDPEGLEPELVNATGETMTIVAYSVL